MIAGVIGRILLSVLLVGCGGDSSGSTTPTLEKPRAASITLSPDTLRLTVGQIGTVAAEVRDIAGNRIDTRDIAWNSSVPSTATVDSTARVTAVGLGLTTIKASVDGVSAVAQIVVALPAIDSARLVRDSVVVRVGTGTSATISAAEVPPGTSISLAELPRRPGDLPAGEGAGWQLAIGLPDSSASAAYLVSTRVSLEVLGDAPVIGAGDTLALAVATGSGSTRRVQLVRTLDTRRVESAIGQTATRVTARIALPSGRAELAIARAPTMCHISDPASRFYRVGRSASADTGADRLALVLIHGWQASQNDCSEVEQYRPEADGPWNGLIDRYFSGRSPVGDRLGAYEAWVMKYPSFQRVDFAASELHGLLRRFLPNRRVVVVAHSMGGLVATRYLTRFVDSTVRHVFTLGTPFAGSPLANPEQRESLKAALRRCDVSALQEALVRTVMTDDSPGFFDLGDGAVAFPRRVLMPSLGPVASRVTALYGELDDQTNYGRDSGLQLSKAFDRLQCSIRSFDGSASDGVVPVASAVASGVVTSTQRLFGFDHSTIYGTQIGKAEKDPQLILADLLRDQSARHAPVVSLTVPAQSLTSDTAATFRLVAIPQDVVGNELPDRPIRWESSNLNIASIDPATGVVRTGRTPGVVTVRASAEEQSVSISITVRAAPDGPIGPTMGMVAAVISREPVGPGEILPFRMVVLNDRGGELDRARFLATVPGFTRPRASTLPDSGRCGSASICSGGYGVTFATTRVDAGQLRAIALGFPVETFPTVPSALSVSGTLNSGLGDVGGLANGALAAVETPVIVAAVDSSSYQPGAAGVVSIRVANPSMQALAGGSVVVELPVGTELAAAVPTAARQNRTLTWQLPTIASGTALQLSATVRLPTAEGVLVIAPELRTTGSSTAAARARVLLPVVRSNAMAVEVLGTQGTVAPNGALSATVRIRNRSTRALTGVRVSLLVPDQTTTRANSIVSGGRCGTQLTCDAGDAITWPATTILPGGELSYSVGFLVDAFPQRRVLSFEIMAMATYEGGGAVHAAVVTRAR